MFNIGTGVETSLNQLADQLLAVMGSTLKPRYAPARKVNPVARRLASVTAARDRLGFRAEVTLDDGLRSLVAWWQSQRSAAHSMKTTVPDIPFARPEFDDAEAAAVAAVLRTGWASQGPAVARFEQLFAERVGAGYGIAVSSCTTALHLALLLAGVEPGDEVICPSYSFIATANAALYAGATPIFGDIDEATWNLDPRDALARVTPRTKVVMPVHQVGLAADLDAFAPLPASVSLVEDAACAIGSTISRQIDRFARTHHLLQLSSSQNTVNRRRRHDHHR